MRTSLDEAVRCFRVGMDAAGSDALIRFTDKMQSVQVAGFPSSPRLLPLLEAIVLAQSRRDYLAVADLLEYEVKPMLE